MCTHNGWIRVCSFAWGNRRCQWLGQDSQIQLQHNLRLMVQGDCEEGNVSNAGLMYLHEANNMKDVVGSNALWNEKFIMKY
jgi:hypothetical protein